MNDNMKLGITADMPNDAYHAAPAIGSTGLKLLQQSPLHYWAACLDPNRVRRESTPAQRIGTAWHCAVFEPKAFVDRYVQIPDGLDRRTKEGKALWSEIQLSGREPMTPDAWDQIERMAGSARLHPVSKVLFDHPEGAAETSMFWVDSETGVTCKIRPDYMVPPCKMFPNGLIVDGKTCEDASPEGFAKQAWNWDMLIQAAFYSDGFRFIFKTDMPPSFVWLAQEKDAPFASAYYSAGEDLIAYGRKTYRRLLKMLADCQRADQWPGYPQTVQSLELPAWASKIVQEEVAA